MNNDAIRIVVSEFYMFKSYPAFYQLQFFKLTIFVFHFLCPEELEYTLSCSSCRLHRLNSLCHLRKRLCKISDIHHKCHDNTKADPSIQCHGTTHYANSYIAEISDKIHDRHHHSGKALCHKTTVH